MAVNKVIVVYPKIAEEYREKIETLAARNGREAVFCQSNGEAQAYLPEAEIVYGMGPDLLGFPGMKWFHSSSSGVNLYLKPGLIPEGCRITNAAGSYGVSIAEYIFMTVLMLFRRMPEFTREMEQHTWDHEKEMKSLWGSRVLVLGTGDIGTEFAKRARAFGTKEIVGINRSGHSAEYFDRTGSLSELEAFLPETDLVVMCLPETGETRMAMSAERLALLPAHACIVNVGRGTSIDQTALVEALNAGRLAGAALDVMAVEPIPEGDPLWTAKNVILTPHCAGNDTLEVTRQKNVSMFCENLERYFAGEELKYLVDLEGGY
ncbi:MAG: D-2-hydroxyacid dehydrogenase [Lachnospiraceae bacterium]|nr:D-2-hydroxyacid dehydrogenase [Lachnospiraceae bacterium]